MEYKLGKCITPRRIKYLPGSKCNYVPILGIGHPRTGTGFTAVSLQRWGLDVLHENIGKDGIVSWFLTFPYGPYLWQHQFLKRPNYDHLIYNVRNPITSLSSIVYTETPHAIRSGFEKNGEVFVVNTKPIIKHDFISHRFRSAYINGIVRENPIESAIRSICGFNDIIRDLKPFTYRIEDQSKLLYKYLKYDYDHIHWVDDQIPYNTREHSSFEKMLSDFPPVMDVYADMINLYCLEHGYEEIKFK
tara:strand:+ start:700 stop:1437 length:738 start_codon:yes stop_codon:yes gene_type:complete